MKSHQGLICISDRRGTSTRKGTSPVGICPQSCPHSYIQADNQETVLAPRVLSLTLQIKKKTDPGSLDGVAMSTFRSLQRETLLRYFLLKSHPQLMPTSHPLPPMCVLSLYRVAGLPVLPHWCEHLMSDPHQNLILGVPGGWGHLFLHLNSASRNTALEGVTKFQGEAKTSEVEVKRRTVGLEKLGSEQRFKQAFHQTQPPRFICLLHTQTPSPSGGIRR